MARTVTFQGRPLTLAGRLLRVHDSAPDFKAVSPDFAEVGLAQFKGKVKVLTAFPSLDTPVCDLQVKEFNKRAAGLGEEIAVIGLSKDLPFAQKRFCDSFGIANVSLASDYKNGSFGINYGLLIRELNLLARAVLIIDSGNTVRYIQIVPELTSPPDYEDVFVNIQKVLKSPVVVAASAPLSCTPCEGGVAALPKGKVEQLMARYRGWEAPEGKRLVKEFGFGHFEDAKYFFDMVAILAEEQGHHPVVTVSYNKVKISLSTHAASGLTENDFIMARLIDRLQEDGS